MFIINPETGRKVDVTSNKGRRILTRYLECYNQVAGADEDSQDDSSDATEITDDTQSAVEKTLFEPKPPPCPVTLDDISKMPVLRRPKGAKYKKYYSDNNLNEVADVPSDCSFVEAEDTCNQTEYSKKGKKCVWKADPPSEWDSKLADENYLSWAQCDSPEHRNYLLRQMKCVKQVTENNSTQEEAEGDLTTLESSIEKKDETLNNLIEELKKSQQDNINLSSKEQDAKKNTLKALSEAQDTSQEYYKKKLAQANKKYNKKRKIIDHIRLSAIENCDPQVVCPSWCSTRIDQSKRSSTDEGDSSDDDDTSEGDDDTEQTS
jgi:uncharacterized coiled-coil protein SlyX